MGFLLITGLFFSEELKFAIANGYSIIKIHNLIQFNKGEAFKELILKLNIMKVNAQKEGKSTIRNLAKLLMNSMYGRFGMHTTREQSALVNNKFDLYSTIFTILSNIELKDYNLIDYESSKVEVGGDAKLSNILRQYYDALTQRTNVAIASAVTAYSRMIINGHKLEAIKLGAEIYYSDTDSLVINKELPPTLVDSAELGKLKHTITEGIFALPNPLRRTYAARGKVYYLLTEDGKEVFKAKGYSGKLTREQYLNLINQKNITNLTVNKWFRSLRDSSIQIKRNQPYEIRYSFNKRRRTGINSTAPLKFTVNPRERCQVC